MMTPRVAAIHDMSGFGRCSLTVAIPILSAMGVQCCPLPTAFLSTHTGGFEGFTFLDMTDEMSKVADHWASLGLTFQAVYSGFLGSERQIGVVEDFIRRFGKDDALAIVDPVMGDHGHAYETYTPEMCEQMKELVCMADVVLPNVTECCILTDTPYREENWTRKELLNMAMMLRLMGAKSVVITGVREGSCYTNVVLEQGQYDAKFIRTRSSGGERPGTGDVFSSVVAGALLNGKSLPEAVSQAAGFVKECIKVSDEEQIPHANGVCFEKILGKLIKK